MTSKKIDDFLEPQEIKGTINLRQQLQQRQEEPKYRIVGFYREKEFQDAPIGKIPKEWKAVELENVASAIYYGVTAKAVEHQTRLRLLRTTDIDNYRVNWDSLPYCEITTKVKDIKKYLVRKGDIIVSRAGTVGMSVLVDRDFDDVVFGSYLIKIRPKDNIVYPKFLHYYFQSKPYWKHISKAQGSTLKNINLEILKTLPIPLPPLEEQWGIAEVLSNVDQAIEIVDRLIQKLQHVRRVLMQELLTKGIGHKEFQDTPIGNIPKGWKITKLAKVAQIIMGQSPPSSSYNEEGIGLPFLQGKAEFGRIFPKPRLYTSKPTKIAEKDDLLISVRAPVGDVNIAPYRLCIGRGLAAIRFNSTSANVLFYFYYFQHIKPILEALGKGTTFKAITRRELEDLQVPLPPVEEQRSIAEILYSIDQAIEANNMLIQKLEHVKKTLMNLLLTGIVRVIVEKEHESAS